MCEDIAKHRRKFQRIGKQHIMVLDETNKREGEVSPFTIVLPGESKIIETSSTGHWGERYDMIASCTSKGPLPSIIYSAKEREEGINTEMLLDFIRNCLAQACGALDVYPLIIFLDRSGIHNEQKMMETFHDWGCQELVEIVKMPPAAAKRLSPLDNALFNLWKTRVLHRGPLTKRNIKQIMSDEWNKITATEIKKQYHHCGLMRGQDVYFDCPNPTAHRHRT
jgi:hypothetical protein